MPTWDTLTWNRFVELEQDDDRIPEKPGTYAVRCAPSGEPRMVNRAFGTDKSGILCFGRTTEQDLRRRVGMFLRASQGKKVAHVEGKRYRQLGYLEHGFRWEDLEVAWKACSDPKEAKDQELSWFEEYSGIFGELPPLNRKCG